MKQYETVFIATPVLSEAQMKEAVAKYVDYITKHGGEVVYEEDWGLKQLAYPIQHKTSFEELVKIMVDADMAKVAGDNASEKVRTNLVEYLEKGIVK